MQLNLIFFWWRIVLVFFLYMPFWAQAQTSPDGNSKISLSEFLEQVRKGNKNFEGAKTSVKGAQLRKEEADLLTSPALFGSRQYLEDKRETGSPLQGDELTVDSWALGIRQQTSFGLEGRLTYNHAKTSLPGANPAFVPLLEYFTVGPVLELTQSLGRNGFGSETTATQDLLSAQIKATEFSESYRQKQILAQAESAYWRLAVARETIEATKEIVDRAEKLRAWSSQRARLNLGNRSDYLQTEAAFLTRKLDLESALNEEKNAARAFNTLRGIDSDVVSEEISVLDEKVIQQLTIPEREKFRDDVKAAEQQKLVAQANARIGVEKNKPDVKLFGSYGLNGRDARESEASIEAGRDDNPYYTIGLRVDIPLDFVTQADVRKGYRAEELAADLNYQQKVFEQERRWKDLNTQFQDSLRRYRMAKAIEQAQRESINYERTRHRRGLTTTFQVLQFEQNFSNAQLIRLRTQAEILNIFSELKTFTGGAL